MASTALSRRVSEFLGVALFAAALIWLISLASYSASDPVWFFNTGSELPPANFAGRVGAFVGELSYQMLGYSAYLVPLVLVVVGWHYFWCRAMDAAYTKLLGAALLFGCISSFLSLAFGALDVGGKEFRAGGVVGDRLAAFLAEYLNRTGSIILILTLLFAAIILSTQFSFGRLFASLAHLARERWAAMLDARAQRKDEKAREKQRQEVLKKHLSKDTKEAKDTKELSKEPKDISREVPKPVVVAKSRPTPAAVGASSEAPAPAPAPKSRTAAIVGAAAAALKAASSKPTPPPPIRKPASIAARDVKDTADPSLLPEPEKAPAERKKGAFTLPPHALLDAPKGERKVDERELMDGARLLEDKCREFSVEGTVVQIHPGPVVTTYEFKPDAGVKYSKITGLADDLCLAMQAESVIIDRIPGKSTVGIQIPNPNREAISLRELLESDAYKRSGSKLTLAMGKTIHGEPFVSDLATMPHLLIAGSTGAGKSVSVNAMITSILMRATPDDVRFIMVDPKRLELGMYEDIPHLLTPVVMDPKLAANALRWAVREMEERYKTLAAFGVRNIEQYNRNIRAMQAEKPGETLLDDKGNELKPLPFIVVLIDELADLMMVAGNEVEESIARLAQMARAIGIHLVLATQRPSVDVITGLIKANMPARISFRVTSKIDSRTILDGNGAEQLLGKGDMLYLPPASSRFVRLHGPYISEQESARLASFLRKQGKPTYDTTVTADEKASQEHMEFDKDELYDEASRIVVSSGQASISYLQRRLRIGFSRAARLVDMMEMDGLVSAAAGGKPREVLVKKDYFEEVDAQLR